MATDSPLTQLTTAVAIIEDSNDETELKKSILTLTQLAPKLSASCTDDISTHQLELISVSYHLARAYLKLPTLTSYGPDSISRKRNVNTANDYFDKYLQTCEDIGLINDAVIKEYHLLLGLLDVESSSDGGRRSQLSAGQIREMKIGRYQRRKDVDSIIKKLEGLEERRKRLSVGEDEEMEGFDGEGLTRELILER